MAIVDEKIRCAECSEWKTVSLEHFEPRDLQRKNGYCRPCKRLRKQRWMADNRKRDSARRKELYSARKSPEAYAELLRRRAILSDEKRRGRKVATSRYRMKRLYGVSEAEYARIAELQGNRCACCGATDNGGRLWCIDHDHNTGAIRGLLCIRCNVGIGALGDTAEGVRRAVAYLERAQQPPPAPALRINLLQGAN